MSLDLARFWQENEASSGKPFRTDKPRAPISLALDDHWLCDEMAVESTVRYYNDQPYRLELNRACNDRCQQAIGLRPFHEEEGAPGPLRLERVLGCTEELHEGGTPWLEPAVDDLAGLRKLIDQMEQWHQDDVAAIAGIRKSSEKPRSAVVRGPATVSTTVLGSERCLWWCMDEPEAMDRFFAALARVYVLYQRALGPNITGFGWLDDNCALFSPALYRRFCHRVNLEVFPRLMPNGGWRYQHSDSDMEHLLPILAELRLNGCNFGPRILAKTIRQAMPETEIVGQLAPMTLRSGDVAAIRAEVLRDWEAVGREGGWVAGTAGSIPAGTKLETIRAWMEIVERDCRYDA